MQPYPILVVGAGPVGLTAALDLALRGQAVEVLDAGHAVCDGSRAICWAKRTLEIFHRLGLDLVPSGITWQRGRVFKGDRDLYQFDLQPDGQQQQPAFINLAQADVERALLARLDTLGVPVRRGHKVVSLAARADGVAVEIETAAGTLTRDTPWLIACDGARSTIRRCLGLSFHGKVFEDRFLIADVRMAADYPTERWFWFDPPFHRGQSALLHRQPDNVWRIDLQLGWDADPDHEREPAQIVPRLRQMLGDRAFELVWASVYTFQCRRLERFRHGRVLFAGDSAHQVSPFGARGANSGIQDVDNLGWKLDRVIRGAAADDLLATYDSERIEAADDNIRHSTRSTDFIAPKGPWANALRGAALDLAAQHSFARPLVNSGRLSQPSFYHASPLSTPDAGFAAGPKPGATVPDAPLAGQWLVASLGSGASLISFGAAVSAADLTRIEVPAGSIAWTRFDATPGTAYLVRPDGYVAARSRAPTVDWLRQATARALGAVL